MRPGQSASPSVVAKAVHNCVLDVYKCRECDPVGRTLRSSGRQTLSLRHQHPPSLDPTVEPRANPCLSAYNWKWTDVYLRLFSPCDGAEIHTDTLTVAAAAAGGRALRRRRSLIKVSTGDAASVRPWVGMCPQCLHCVHCGPPYHRLSFEYLARPSPHPSPPVALWSRSSPQAAPTSDPCNEKAIHYVFQARAFVSGRCFFSHRCLLTLLTRHTLSPSDWLFTGAANSARLDWTFPYFLF